MTDTTSNPDAQAWVAASHPTILHGAPLCPSCMEPLEFAPPGATFPLVCSTAAKAGCEPSAVDMALRTIAKRQEGQHDRGNARRLVIDHALNLRYAPGIGWLHWDGERWARAELGQEREHAKRTMRHYLADANALARHSRKNPDPDEQKNTKQQAEAKAVVAHAKQSNNVRFYTAALAAAQTDPSIAVASTALDADPWLLNVQNGTVDLRTGELRDHQRVDLITKIAGAPYNPDARSERWETFLAEAFLGDVDTIAWAQKYAGMTLTGVTREEVFAIFYGPGGSGKTTLLEAVAAAAGDYARAAAFTTFVTQRQGGHREDLARLRGARMAFSSEVGDGAKFDAPTMKTLTGGDTVVASHKHGREFEYQAQFTLWLAANDRPAIDPNDTGMWRRVRCIPMRHQPTKADKQLKKLLCEHPDERAAILAWAIAGAALWHTEGLHTPDTIQRETDAYRTQSNPAALWITDRTIRQPGAWTSRKDAHEDHARGAAANGDEPLDPGALARGLRAHGYRETKRHGTRGWADLQLSTDDLGAPGGTPSENFSHAGARVPAGEGLSKPCPQVPPGQRGPHTEDDLDGDR